MSFEFDVSDSSDQRLLATYAAVAKTQEELDNLQTNDDAHRIGKLLPELDRAYPYFGEPVYASGEGLFPELDEDGSIVGESFRQSDGAYGIHYGFAVVEITDEEGKLHGRKVMHQILVSDVESNQLVTIEQHTKIFHYLAMESSILPINEIDDCLASYKDSSVDLDDCMGIISDHSKRFVETLRSTKFRRTNKSRQNKIVEFLLDEADSAARVRDLTIMAEPEYGYAPLRKNNKNRDFVPMLLSQTIGGVCLGLDTLETGVMARKAIRRDSDLANRDAGLCLVLDPDESTRSGLKLNDTQVIFIPTYNQVFETYLFAE